LFYLLQQQEYRTPASHISWKCPSNYKWLRFFFLEEAGQRFVQGRAEITAERIHLVFGKQIYFR